MLHGIINQLKWKLTSAKQAPAKLISPSVVVEKEKLLINILDESLNDESLNIEETQEILMKMKKIIDSLDSDPTVLMRMYTFQHDPIRKFYFLFKEIQPLKPIWVSGKSEWLNRSYWEAHPDAIVLKNQFDISYLRALYFCIDFIKANIKKANIKKDDRRIWAGLNFLYNTLEQTNPTFFWSDKIHVLEMRIFSLSQSALDTSLTEIETGLLSPNSCFNMFERFQKDMDFLKKHNVDITDFQKRLEKIYLPLIWKQVNFFRKDCSLESLWILFPSDGIESYDRWELVDDRHKEINNIENILDSMELHGIDVSVLKNEFVFLCLDDIRAYTAYIEDDSNEWRMESKDYAPMCRVLRRIITFKKMGHICPDFENRLKHFCIEMTDNELKKYESNFFSCLEKKYGRSPQRQQGGYDEYDISHFEGILEIPLMIDLGWDIPDLISRNDKLRRSSFDIRHEERNERFDNFIRVGIVPPRGL